MERGVAFLLAAAAERLVAGGRGGRGVCGGWGRVARVGEVDVQVAGRGEGERVVFVVVVLGRR